MAEDEQNTRTVSIKRTEEGRFRMSVPEFQAELLKNEAEKLGMSRSAALRMWLALGREVHNQADPRDVLPGLTNGESQSDDSIKNFILSNLPTESENPISIDEAEERLNKRIRRKLREMAYGDGEVELTDNEEVFVRDE